MKYYITKLGYVACVDKGTFSLHYKDEDPDGYIESPFLTRSARELGWKEVQYCDLPDWAKEQFDELKGSRGQNEDR